MSNTTKVIIALVVVAVIAGGAVLMAGGGDDTANTGSNGTNNSNNSDGEDAEVAATITYTDSGFSPSSVTVKSGQAIRVVNESSGVVGPSSDSHPAHDQNTELNFPDIDPGQSATMTVTTKGAWGMHNHLKEDHGTTIIVE